MKMSSTPGIFLFALCLAGSAIGAPTGASVVSGQAVFPQSPKVLNVTNTPNAVINWQSVPINKDEVTRFIQQPATSAVLNRVTVPNPSQILGTLQSNDRVYLLSPAGLTNTTQILIEAKGTSFTGAAGDALKLAPGESMTVADPKSPDIKYQITAPQNRTLDVGQLMGTIGNKGAASALTNRAGTNNANTAVIGENGNVVLKSIR
jgi:filamentous hemagglutinin family protein